MAYCTCARLMYRNNTDGTTDRKIRGNSSCAICKGYGRVDKCALCQGCGMLPGSIKCSACNGCGKVPIRVE